jgi:hypothetical protein
LALARAALLLGFLASIDCTSSQRALSMIAAIQLLLEFLN